MANKKTSALTELTTPDDADQLPVVDTSESETKRTTWANFKATLKTYFDSIYSASANGVTNGNSHDHSGGDGAQIAYSSLSGTPTLGDSATKNVGTTTGTVAAGDDSRFVTSGNSHDHNGGDGAAITEAALSLSDNTTANVSASAHGFCPKIPNNTTTFLRGDGTFATPAGGGDVSSNTATSVDGELALFNSTTGKSIKRATSTGIIKASSGVIGVASQGTDYYAPSGTDVAVADGGTGASTAASAALNLDVIPADGWMQANETWTYASASTFTISGDKTGKYQRGDKIKLTNSTVKYFYITAVAYGAPNTTVTVTGGTDYSLVNTAISSPYFSKVENPHGFPDYFSYTPTVGASGSMTYTSVSVTAKFKLIGKNEKIWIYCAGTIGGTLSYGITFTPAINASVSSGGGIELMDNGTDQSGGYFYNTGSNIIEIRKATGSNFTAGTVNLRLCADLLLS